MHHIRDFFRPHPTTRVGGRSSVARDDASKNSAAQARSRSRGSPTRSRLPNESASSGDGAARAERRSNTVSSVVSGTALDHLYESYCDNITAGELKSQSDKRRPFMVVREYNCDYIVPDTSNTSVFLPREYNLVGDDDYEEGVEEVALSDLDDFADALGDTQRGTTQLNGGGAADSAAGATSTNATATFGAPASRSRSTDDDVDGTGNVYGAGVAADPAPPLHSSLTTANVTASNVKGQARDGRGSSGSAGQKAQKPPGKRSKQEKEVAPNAGRGTPPSRGKGPSAAATAEEQQERKPHQPNGDALAAEPHAPPPVRRYSISSLSFLEDEAKIHGHVRCVIAPSSSAAAGAGDVEGVGDAADSHRASEVEIVRLNEALFTPTELARWRRYKMARMDSFMGATTPNVPSTPSASTRSRDAPSSSSASGPEFMPTLGTANLASDTSVRGWDELESGVGAEGRTDIGVPASKGRLIRVSCIYEADSDAPRRKLTAVPTSSSQPPTLPVTARPVATSTAQNRAPVARPVVSPQNQASAPHLGDLPPIGSRSGIRNDSFSSSSHSSDSSDASSATSGSSSRSLSISSIDTDVAEIQAASLSTTSEAVQLPDIFGKARELTSNTSATSAPESRRHEHSSGTAPSSYIASHDGSAEELHPLPPVHRAAVPPAFRRRVH
ncbi:hypothetical protein ABB37_07390 [Leptomonas pyrrhocoris]|uniref:Uncharacterized protein n=1 Tax=Leptomonas pyrrhocoris TaxID=157538 RepID=A0A0N0VE58_LEPPY|nr:hypothetical protein ABB37_07390 [Leptomonas pyrrhocoris]XP_015655491.1 hypothetical protein ABB37_07390 [Leptomonas pyrrhocoris]KPA77051.1 hypothetical protein ABB37_07390 [Leptomonas pyrrhocoris]KPA77052.1 hypothetical protein ABB37_07390 [Leptomonas pyrrhocoris]|eukprot:XP_015655490.1 hypothetical protein ABB37_07390 [Leptomonas pyrrhocoris]